MKVIHQNLLQLDPILVEAGSRQNKKKEKKNSQKKKSDKNIRHLMLRMGCLIMNTGTQKKSIIRQ